MERSKQKAKEEQRRKVEAYEALKKKEALEEEMFNLQKKQNKLKQKKNKKLDSESSKELSQNDTDEAPGDSSESIDQIDRQQMIDTQWDDMLGKVPNVIV